MRSLLLSLIILASLFLAVHGSVVEEQWYVSVNPSQVQLIVGPTNSSYIITLLQGAKKAVYIEVYELTYSELAKTLEDLASRGVQVYLVLSANVYGGVPSTEKELVQEMEASGVNVTFLSGFNYVHSKVFVIDNETVILGSINPTYSGLRKDLGVDLVIHNSTIAEAFASVILSDYYGVPVNNVSFPGMVVSPINSYSYLKDLLSQSGTVYLALEEVYQDSGLVGYISSHSEIVGVANRGDAISELGLKQMDNVTAKVIVVGDYVYVGSINLSHSSLYENRELGIIIKDPQLAAELKSLIATWSGQVQGPTKGSGSFGLPGYVTAVFAFALILLVLALLLRR